MKKGIIFAATVTPNNRDVTIEGFIANVIGFILPIAAALLMIAIIYGGFLYITSAGDSEKVTKAKKTLLWSVAGVILIVISYSVVVAINNVINTNILGTPTNP